MKSPIMTVTIEPCPDCGGPVVSSADRECLDKLGCCIDCVNHDEVIGYGTERLSQSLLYILGVSP